MTHFDLEEEKRLEVGIKDNFIRFSVGLEDAEDLIRDLDQALKIAVNILSLIHFQEWTFILNFYRFRFWIKCESHKKYRLPINKLFFNKISLKKKEKTWHMCFLIIHLKYFLIIKT
jgi:hypothetical protein